MKTVTLDIDLEDRSFGEIDAIVIVYQTTEGIESSFRRFPESPLPVETCAASAYMAIRDIYLAAKKGDA